MDPRTAATVTAPDLLAAFRGEAHDEVSDVLRIWLVLFTDGPTPSIDLTRDYPLRDLHLVIELVRAHLSAGAYKGVALEVAAVAPEMFSDASISQIAG